MILAVVLHVRLPLEERLGRVNAFYWIGVTHRLTTERHGSSLRLTGVFHPFAYGLTTMLRSALPGLKCELTILR